MEVVERQIVGKEPDPAACEDLIVVTADFAAVVDGATDKTEIDFDGRTGGLLAAEAVRDALLGLDRDAELPDLIGLATSRLVEEVGSSGVGADVAVDDGPSASFVAYSDARREVWRVGDCSWRCETGVFEGRKKIDTIAAEARSALLRALLANGVSEEELLGNDPGREMILPLLRGQEAFRNLDDPSSGLAFGAIAGREVPDRFLEIWPIEDAEGFILASDGYPVLEETLEESEAVLHDELKRDPLRIERFPSTKAMGPGMNSFDDRSYLRIAT